MSFSVNLLVTFLVSTAVVLVTVRGHQLDEICLGCICEASTNCTVNTGCSVPYPGSYFCGPFLISYAYWTDAGQPVLAGDNPNTKGSFENCALDLQCAAETVVSYMKEFKQDCNNDGKIDCDDYVRVHGRGGFSCGEKIFEKTALYAKFARCFGVVRAATVNSNTIHSFQSLLRSSPHLHNQLAPVHREPIVAPPVQFQQPPLVQFHQAPQPPLVQFHQAPHPALVQVPFRRVPQIPVDDYYDDDDDFVILHDSPFQ